MTISEKECINRFEKLEEEFLKDSTRLAEYIHGITDELHKLGVEMIKESLETMDRMLQESPVRLKNWVVETHSRKQLTTSLGDVTFRKTLFTSKTTGKSEYWKANNIYDLAGNVYEWTQEKWSTYTNRVCRGGIRDYDGDRCPAAYRGINGASSTHNTVGFRASFYL